MSKLIDMDTSKNEAVTGESNASRVEGRLEDYLFVEGPTPIGAKTFGFDGEGQSDAKVACILYSATIPNATRGIDVRGNYWCIAPDFQTSEHYFRNDAGNLAGHCDECGLLGHQHKTGEGDALRVFNEDYPRFICTASITPDGLFWSVWDRFNNCPITTGFEHRIVRPYCDKLNQSWGAQQSPAFNAF